MTGMRERPGVPRFALYAAVGALGTGAHYSVLVATVWLGWLAPVAGSACGALVGAAVNFLLNARLTFRSRPSWGSAARFVLTAALAAGANALAMTLLVGRLSVPWPAAQVIVTASLLLLTFLVNSLWTFR
jgi:putative flippase GtrA